VADPSVAELPTCQYTAHVALDGNDAVRDAQSVCVRQKLGDLQGARHLFVRDDYPYVRLVVEQFGHRDAEVAKRIDIAAVAIHHGMTVDAISDLDLSYTPPLGSP
jgi:hypothetical protein